MWTNFTIQQDYESESWVLFGHTRTMRAPLGKFPTVAIAEEVMRRLIAPVTREYDDKGQFVSQTPPTDPKEAA